MRSIGTFRREIDSYVSVRFVDSRDPPTRMVVASSLELYRAALDFID